MDTIETEIRFVKHWNTNEIVNLYKAGGWWKDNYSPSDIDLVIKGSFAFALAIEISSGKAIGMGRLISDGVSDAYIQDLVILKEYRGIGIGTKIVKSLIEKCNNKNIQWLALIAEPNQSEFYLPLGFKTMENYTPMKFNIER